MSQYSDVPVLPALVIPAAASAFQSDQVAPVPKLPSPIPLVRTEDLVGALFHPTDGYINPADVTQAMAKGARQMGPSKSPDIAG